MNNSDPRSDASPAAPLPWSSTLRPAELASRKPTRFDISPDAETRARIAAWAGIEALDSLHLKGTMTPLGRTDWKLEAEFGAVVVQACVVTLAPVTTALTEPVVRRYVADLPEPEGTEVEIPEDDSLERLPPVIDLAAVALETLELALPLYPRAEGAELPATNGEGPTADDTRRPFADLGKLLGRKTED